MRIRAGELELEVARGTSVEAIVAFADAQGQTLPGRPWCGPVRLTPGHRAGDSPLTAWSALSCVPGPDARPQPGVHLAVVAGPDAGAVATLADGMVLGRGETAAVRIDDPLVSRRHAIILRGRIRDLGSRNGALVNGRRLRWPRTLRQRDVIQLGATVLEVRGAEAGDTESTRKGAPAWGLASGGVAAVSMAGFAVMSGHWPLALVALVLPAAGGLASLASRRRALPPPSPIDVTGLERADLAAGPVAVAGPRGLVRAVTLARGRPSEAAPEWEPWMALLAPAANEMVWLRPGQEAPSWAAVRVSAQNGLMTVESGGETTATPLPLVSARLADASARRQAARAEDANLPGSVRWAELPQPHGELAVRLGVSAAGPVQLDLVADGPHVLVAGTTGSGKSEALRTIVASLAHDYSPRDVAFALIDFKGGAGLGPCARLPHVASVLTDLEPHLARRALLALSAELAQRKAAMATSGATTFTEWSAGRPPRLVLAVDEFQEIAAADRDFLPQLARLAAQGRSLGIHLVLATQRPAGAVGAEVRANISATLALRTASDSESRDLIGSGAAALIQPDAPGRALLQRGTTVTELQVALPLAEPPPPIRVIGEREVPGRSLLDAARERHQGPAVAPLWLPELPSRIGPATEPACVIGICDLPRERTRARLAWDPAAGPLVITGPPRSGRTTALTAASERAAACGLIPVLLPEEPRLAVRTLAIAISRPSVMLAIDDAGRAVSAAVQADPEALDLLAIAIQRLPIAVVVPPSWPNHRLTASAGLRIIMTGLSEPDEAGWSVPAHLRGIAPRPGRARAHDADGWREAQLCTPGDVPWATLADPLPAELPAGLTLPADSIGIGGDRPAPVRLPRGPAAVVGPHGAERDSVAKRVAIATRVEPVVTDTALAFGLPGQPAPRAIVIVRPTARAVRDVLREAPRGLVDVAPPRLRAVVVVDGTAQAVQVLGG